MHGENERERRKVRACGYGGQICESMLTSAGIVLICMLSALSVSLPQVD